MGEESKLKINFEIIFIAIFAAIFLFLALSEPWEHRIIHPFPYSYLASDAFFHQSTSQYLKEQGTVTTTPPWIVGGYEEVTDPHPPMLFQLTGAISTLSRINVHDSIMVIAVLSFLFAILMIYLIWKQSNKGIAIIALSICLLMLDKRLTPLIFWGYWLLLTGILFMVASLWAITKFDVKYSYILIALFLSATALAHQSEFVYAGIFLAGFLIFRVFNEKKISKALFKKTAIIAMLIGILSFYSLSIFLKTLLKSEGYRNVWDMSRAAVGGYPVFNLINLGIMGVMALIGFLLFIFSKKGKAAIPAWVSLFCFMLGHLIYAGIGKRAYAHRLFWIMYLSFFFGFAVYYITKMLIKNLTTFHSFGVSIIILAAVAASVYGNTQIGQGIMNPYDWDALNWIAQNLPKDAQIYYFYSDALSNNAPLYNSKRLAFNINTQPYFEDVQSQQIKRKYLFHLAKGYSTYLHKTGPLSFCYFDKTLKPKDGSFQCLKEYKKLEVVPEQDLQKDVCGIEYLYFTKVTGTPVVAQYNLAIMNLLLKNEWIKEIYSNPLVSILENEKPGVDCFGNNTE